MIVLICVWTYAYICMYNMYVHTCNNYLHQKLEAILVIRLHTSMLYPVEVDPFIMDGINRAFKFIQKQGNDSPPALCINSHGLPSSLSVPCFYLVLNTQ